jgi:hypothetical protein
MRVRTRSYYHLRRSDDGRFTMDSVIAYIDIDTTDKERILIADLITEGEFSRYRGFYEIAGPFKTPPIYHYR